MSFKERVPPSLNGHPIHPGNQFQFTLLRSEWKKERTHAHTHKLRCELWIDFSELGTVFCANFIIKMKKQSNTTIDPMPQNENEVNLILFVLVCAMCFQFRNESVINLAQKHTIARGRRWLRRDIPKCDAVCQRRMLTTATTNNTQNRSHISVDRSQIQIYAFVFVYRRYNCVIGYWKMWPCCFFF